MTKINLDQINQALKEDDGANFPYDVIIDRLQKQNLKVVVEGVEINDESQEGNFLEDISAIQDELKFELFKEEEFLGNYRLSFLDSNHENVRFEEVA